MDQEVAAVKVFVAGASGALGIPVLRALVSHGHEVTGTTRSPDRRRRIAEAGAKPVVTDALDREAIRSAVASAAPEAVVDVLTALPRPGPRRAADLRATNQVRRQGSRNLLEAARAAGARRYVAESFFLVYGDGDHGPEPLSEEAQVPAREPSPPTREAVDALLAKEGAVLTAARGGRIEGMVLRFGGFYGPAPAPRR
ncbi:MAG TPA: NAD(P)-dependent oxidoreductase [Candidatus Dormibacteraeota bacterium]|nr:NAD(P)-dependent oxidoreductase [Candidatus Dormibacteraeota bacterium]